MDDLILALLDAIFWLFILDFDKKGQAAAKIIFWIVLVLMVGGFFVFAI